MLTNSVIYAISGLFVLIDFSPYGFMYFLLCYMPGNFWLDAKHCEFDFVGWWSFFLSVLWALLQNATVKLLGNNLIYFRLPFKLVGSCSMSSLALSWGNALLRILLDTPCVMKLEHKLFFPFANSKKYSIWSFGWFFPKHCIVSSHGVADYYSDEDSLDTLCRSLEFSLCRILSDYLSCKF